MEEKKLYVCGKCHRFWSADREKQVCIDCGGRLNPVEQDYEQYAAMTDEEKAAFKESYLAQHTLKSEPDPEPTREEAAMNSLFWINTLDVLLNILLALLCVGVFFSIGYILMFALNGNALESMFNGLVTFFGAFLGIAIMKVLLGMARDLKALRRKMSE